MPSRKAPPTAPAHPGHQLSDRFADPDLVDRIFDYMLQLLPELAARAPEIKGAIRDEFGGAESYVRTGLAELRSQRTATLATEVLSHFNGRNASEVARRLNISRATVYRLLKQPGRR
ncbi:MAG: hypothetical protein RL375_4134 [Pseudomonadota bacterium]|jgi:transcriptional regulator of acetoin/glycerol metabolism